MKVFEQLIRMFKEGFNIYKNTIKRLNYSNFKNSIYVKIIKSIIMGELSVKIITGFILLGTVFGAPFLEIHHEMTPEERLQVFQTSGTDVPRYEIVEIQSSRIKKRATNAGHHIKIRAFHEEIEHYLTPIKDTLVSESTPIKEAKFIRGNERTVITNSSVSMSMVSKFIYQDLSYGITLSIRSLRGRREISGYIGYKNWHVSPVPNRLRRSLNINKSEEEEDDKSFHIIHQISNSDGQNVTAPLFRVQRSTFQEQETVRPEILVIVDNKLFEMLNRNIGMTILYVIAFWNGVDIMYRDLNDPAVRLNIATILIAQDDMALKYIEWYRKNQVIATKTLEKMQYWLWNYRRQLPLNTYDVSFTMIGSYDMGEIVNYEFEGSINGIAYTGAACSYSKVTRTVSKVGIVTDIGNFAHIRVAAHELGHLFGSYHDGEGNSCKNDGAILDFSSSTHSESQYSHSFSECTREQFKDFFYQEESACLWNDPIGKSKSLPRILPGKLISVEDQCLDKPGYPIPVIEESMCRILMCENGEGKFIFDGRPAADGTTCGKNKICLHGSCVDERKVVKNPYM